MAKPTRRGLCVLHSNLDLEGGLVMIEPLGRGRGGRKWGNGKICLCVCVNIAQVYIHLFELGVFGQVIIGGPRTKRR